MNNEDKRYLDPMDTRPESIERYWYNFVHRLAEPGDKAEFTDMWDTLKAAETNEEFLDILKYVADEYFSSMFLSLKNKGYQAIKASKYSGEDFLYHSLEKINSAKSEREAARELEAKSVAAAKLAGISPDHFYDSTYRYSDSSSAYSRGKEEKVKVYSAIQQSYDAATDTFDKNKFLSLVRGSR